MMIKEEVHGLFDELIGQLVPAVEVEKQLKKRLLILVDVCFHRTFAV